MNYIKEIRLARGMTQASVAKKMGYESAQFISNWERDVSKFTRKKAAQIAKIYNVPVQILLEYLLDEDIQRLVRKYKAMGLK